MTQVETTWQLCVQNELGLLVVKTLGSRTRGEQEGQQVAALFAALGMDCSLVLLKYERRWTPETDWSPADRVIVREWPPT